MRPTSEQLARVAMDTQRAVFNAMASPTVVPHAPSWRLLTIARDGIEAAIAAMQAYEALVAGKPGAAAIHLADENIPPSLDKLDMIEALNAYVAEQCSLPQWVREKRARYAAEGYDPGTLRTVGI